MEHLTSALTLNQEQHHQKFAHQGLVVEELPQLSCRSVRGSPHHCFKSLFFGTHRTYYFPAKRTSTGICNFTRNPILCNLLIQDNTRTWSEIPVGITMYIESTCLPRKMDYLSNYCWPVLLAVLSVLDLGECLPREINIGKQNFILLSICRNLSQGLFITRHVPDKMDVIMGCRRSFWIKG